MEFYPVVVLTANMNVWTSFSISSFVKFPSDSMKSKNGLAGFSVPVALKQKKK